MSSKDGFLRIMLVVIAVLLALNLFKSSGFGLESTAQAQIQKKIGDAVRVFDVKPVRGYEVKELQDIVALGDGKSFVVRTGDKFMVYQLDSF
jgi:hypothetical protein